MGDIVAPNQAGYRMTREEVIDALIDEVGPISPIGMSDGDPDHRYYEYRFRSKKIFAGTVEDVVHLLDLFFAPPDYPPHYPAAVWYSKVHFQHAALAWIYSWTTVRPDQVRAAIQQRIDTDTNRTMLMGLCGEIYHEEAFAWIADILQAAAKQCALTEELQQAATLALQGVMKEVSHPTHDNEIEWERSFLLSFQQ